jgi:hypothetical protein
VVRNTKLLADMQKQLAACVIPVIPALQLKFGFPDESLGGRARD